jgi:anti-sigma regulatory factor (Ser/Thr protein kinase)
MDDVVARMECTGAAESIPDARRFVAACLTGQSGQAIDVASLLVTELATNAVVHTHGGFEVQVAVGPASIRVGVHDHDPQVPRHLPPEPGRIGGWGIHLVDRLAASWGVDGNGEGKWVWFELDAARARRTGPIAAGG